MLITRLELFRYKRFSLNLDGLFVLEPKHLNILTWGNGSGKSSLLSQLSPFPPEFKKDFLEDGYKKIFITFNNGNYVLLTDKSGHSFIKDNVELNDGKTKRVQLELIEHNFNLSSNILPLLFGSNNFTTLSPLDRKNFLTKISTIDFTYSLNVYSKLLEIKKENTILLKYLKEELLEKTKLVITKEELLNIKKEEQDLKKLQETIYGCYYNDIDKTNIEDILNTYENLNREINKYENIEKFNKEEKLNLENKIKLLQQEENNLEKELNDLEKSIDKEYNSEILKAIEILKTRLENTIPNFTKDPIVVRDNLLGLSKNINNYLTDYENFTDSIKHLTKEKVEVLEKELISLLSKKNLNNFLIEKNIRLKCSKCSTPVNFSLTEVSDEIIMEKKEQIRVYKNLEERQNKIMYIIENNPYLEYFKDFKVTIDNISGFHNVVLVFISKLEIYIDNFTKLEKLNNELKRYEIIADITKANKKEKIENLKTKIKNTELLKKELIVKLNKIMEIEKLYVNFENILNEIDNTNLELETYRKSIYKQVYNNTLNILKDKIDYLIQDLNNVLVSSVNIEKNIEEIKKQIENINTSINTANTLIEILNPNTGLIAKSIKSFLGYILEDVNNIVNSVWSYPIEVILDLDNIEEALSYKFKVIVNNDRSNIIEDINKLSSGMQEIINLAFRIVFLKTLNKKIELPLLLDEFGKSMDMEHRISCFNLIDKLLNNFKQIYLVSHFESMHGRFSHAYYPTYNSEK